MRNSSSSILLTIVAAGVLHGCAASEISSQTEDPAPPPEWARGGDEGTLDVNWLDDVGDPRLSSLVSEGGLNHFQLAQERARVYQAEQSVLISRSNRRPSLDATVNGSRRAFEDASATGIANDSFSAQFTGRWNVDVWGQLSAAQKAAELRLAASLARFEFTERSLASSTAGA